MLGGEVHARRKVWRARKLAIRTCNWTYERGPSPKKRTCKKCGIIRSHKEAARWEERVSTAEKKKSQL